MPYHAAMSGRRVVAMLIVLYLGSDLVLAWLPGVFFFGNDDLFIETVVEGKTRPARLLAAVPVPPTVVAPGVREVLSRARDTMTDPSPWRARSTAHGRPSERPSPEPSSPDDH